MTAVIDMPMSRPLTVADLADRPDDGHRYELLDGVLIVTPAPSMRHQDAAFGLGRLLHAACSGAYVEVASVSGPEEFAAQVPFAVTVVPDDLVDPDLPSWAR